MDDFRQFKTSLQMDLAELNKAQLSLQELATDKKIKVYEDIYLIANDLTNILENKLQVEEQGVSAKKTITEILSRETAKLTELDSRINHLQLDFSTNFNSSLKDTGKLSNEQINVGLLNTALKDIQIGITNIQRSQDRKSLIMAKSKLNIAMNKTVQNDYVVKSNSLTEQLKSLVSKVDELIKLQGELISTVGVVDEQLKSQISVAQKDINDKLSVLILGVESSVVDINDKYGSESQKQNTIYGMSTIATNVLRNNSEFTTIGMSIEALSTKLFAVTSESDLQAVVAQLKAIYLRVSTIGSMLNTDLTHLNAKQELQILKEITSYQASIKELLFTGDGIIQKISQKLALQEKANNTYNSIHNLVAEQTINGNNTISQAQIAQVKTIKRVNTFIVSVILLIIAIGIIAVIIGQLFSNALKRSIVLPLADLSNTVAVLEKNGDFSKRVSVLKEDEVGLTAKAFNSLLESFQGSISAINQVMLAVSREDLSQRVNTSTKGDLELLKNCINSSIQTLSNALQNIGDYSSNFAQSALQCSKAVEQVSNGIQNQVHTVSQITESVNQTANIVAEASKNTETANHRAKEAAKLIEESYVEVIGLKTVMAEIEDSGEKVSNITTIISDIANKTNLLSLNASIEAARAGKHGRGFGVVANEVHTLAAHSAQSAKAIAELIEQSVEQTRRGVQSTDAVITMVEKMVSAVVETKAQLEEISKAMDISRTSMVSVDKRLGTLHEIEQTNASAIEQITASIEQLSSLAEETRVEISRFKF